MNIISMNLLRIHTSSVQTVLDLLSGIGQGEEAAEAIINKEIISNG